LAIGLGIRACQASHRVLFATASRWVTRLATPTTPAGCKANSPGSPATPLLIVDEVDYIPFGPEAGNLFFQPVSSRYERLIATSNKPFGRWGEVFGGDVVAAMIDRLVHHAVVALKATPIDSGDRDLSRVPAANANEP
jgi:DNA replication protein DnaC